MIGWYDEICSNCYTYHIFNFRIIESKIHLIVSFRYRISTVPFGYGVFLLGMIFLKHIILKEGFMMKTQTELASQLLMRIHKKEHDPALITSSTYTCPCKHSFVRVEIDNTPLFNTADVICECLECAKKFDFKYHSTNGYTYFKR